MHGAAWGLIIAVVLLVCVASLRSGGGYGRVDAKPLLTDREVKFWHLLIAAAAPLHVAPQVAMGALLTARGDDRSSWRSARNRFAQKIVDFVLLGDDGDVRLLIELDDRTHVSSRDAERDRMTAAAGYKTLRVVGVTARDYALLKTAVDAALGNPPGWSPPVFNPATAPRRARNRSAPPSTPPA